MTMFYSHLLLSKKGPLGTIWIAAHCHKRLKKDLVLQTNIPSSVDKILLDEVPIITYRILGFLLLGVVRIYSKKVEYLFHDCRDVLNEICHFVDGRKTSTDVRGMCAPESSRKKKVSTQVEAVCAPYSAITLPENFELDSFNLDIMENDGRDHLKPREEIMLNDAMETDRSWHLSLDKDNHGEVFANCEDHPAAYSSLTDIPSPQYMEEHTLVQSSHNLSNWEASMETFRDNRFSLEEPLDPMILCEGEEELDFLRPFDKREPFADEHETEGENIKSSVAEFVEDAELSDQNRPVDEEQHTNAEKKMLSEMPTTETLKLQVTPDNCPVSITIDVTPESMVPTVSEMPKAETVKLQVTPGKRPVSINIDVTPESMVPNTSGAATPDFMAVRTPAPKERARASRKRKCLYDDIIVLPNNIFKEWINDSSDLVCKRRKAPHTALHAWKEHRIFNLSESFLEPIISSFSLDLTSTVCKKKLENLEPVETTETPAKYDGNRSPTINRSLEEEAEFDGLRSHTNQRSTEEDIAPSTPVTHSTSLRFSEINGISKLVGAGPTSSCESREKELPPNKDGELNEILMNEEFNSLEGDSQENHLVADKWFARTRTVARYLHRNFLCRKKRREEEAMNLSQVLKGKTEKESARFFYELLVLKTGGYVDVEQEKAYDEIFLMETLKLKKACEGDGSK